MKEVGEKFLPVGTVVLLKGATKRIMITGFASVSPDTGEKIFDYSGCLFPEGFYNYNEVCIFDHIQIEEVFHLGLIDDEETAFKAELKVKFAELTAPKAE